MSRLLEKIKEQTRYSNPDKYAELAIEILTREIELIEERLFCLEHSDEIEAKRRGSMTTAQRCREDNERI